MIRKVRFAGRRAVATRRRAPALTWAREGSRQVAAGGRRNRGRVRGSGGAATVWAVGAVGAAERRAPPAGDRPPRRGVDRQPWREWFGREVVVLEVVDDGVVVVVVVLVVVVVAG